MKLNVFSIFDEKAQAFNVPFFKSHVGQALRDFSDICQDPKSSVARHLSDFSLYHIGEFDDNDAVLVSYPEPRLVSRGSEYSRSVPVSVS